MGKERRAQAIFYPFSIWTIWDTDRTSAQPQVKLSFLHSNYLSTFCVPGEPEAVEGEDGLREPSAPPEDSDSSPLSPRGGLSPLWKTIPVLIKRIKGLLYRVPECLSYMLNMEVDLQSLFGLHVTWCAQLYSLAETPQLPTPPPAFGLVYGGSYWSATIDDISL